GFCQRLLREFPIEAEVDPNFEVFDEAARHILLNRLLDELIQERSASNDRDIRLSARLWTPVALRGILRQLLNTRDKSLPWTENILQQSFPAYLNGLYELKTYIQRQKLEQLRQDREWRDCIEHIPGLIPPGDSSKLSLRCRTVSELDAEFRQQSDLEQQILMLGMLRKNLSLTGVNKAWKEDNRKEELKELFGTLKTLYARYVAEYKIHDTLEQSSFALQQALARLFEAACERYTQEKHSRRILDFDDLQEAALKLTRHPDVQPILARRFDYIMVDEFQDTNQMQWEIIRSFGNAGTGLDADTFCIVGDEKQSIYMFRGANVAVFADVRQEIRQANAAHQTLQQQIEIPEMGDLPEQREEQKGGELIMAENFRSSKELIFFFNALFSRLFLQKADPYRPFDVIHQHMLSRRAIAKASDRDEAAQKKSVHHPVEFLLTLEDEQSPGSVLDEAESIAQKILGFVKDLSSSDGEENEGPRWKFGDIAILLRTRTKMKEFEEALRRYDIPFVVAGGIGFYEQQEIYDLANLLCFLADQRQDIALAGVLRSPLFSFSDDQLFYVSAGILSDEVQQRWNLWERLRHHAQTPDLIPEEFDASKFAHAYQRLTQWKELADRIPITHLLRRILDDSGLYGILSGSERAEQSLNNIEKLLDIARNFENEGFQALTDFVRYFDELIAIGEREGEAQLSTEGMNVVQFMTIHAAKGLEFPVVFVPELDRSFNYGSNDPIYLDALPRQYRQKELGSVTAGIKGLDPEENYAPDSSFLREYLKDLNKEKTDAEMKRLLYVACTRAEDCLILSGTLKDKKVANSWLTWLDKIFALEEHFAQGNDTIKILPSVPDDDVEALEVPLRVAAEGSRSTQSVERRTGRSASDSTRSVEGNRNHAERGYEKIPPGPSFPEGGPGEISASPELLDQMERNLKPLKGVENEIFSVSPSTLHLLYHCPRKYYYREILGFGEELLRHMTPPSEGPDAPPGYGAKRGTIIHKFFEQRAFDAGNQQEIRYEELLEAEGIPRTRQEVERLKKASTRAAEHYASSGLQQLFADSPELYRERPFQMKIGQALISGVIDVLFRDPASNVWTILDYKSHEVKESQIDAEIKKHGYDLQMQMYAIAVSHLLQVDTVHSILFFTSPGIRYEAVPLSPEKLRHVEESLAEHLKNISLNRIALAENLQECDECGFRRSGICL
ncbi:MAG: UvrD-helicase domain-containing protein, partial [bacterium]|nr:UvrD-helicase domain-containing protein [bacterium]